MDVDARLEALEAENERLRDEIRMLREAAGHDFGLICPIEWRLTGSETGVFGVLFRRESCTKEQIMAALYEPGVDDEPEIKIIDVFICKLRKKIAPFGLSIETIWGRGYRLTPEVKAIAKALIAPEPLGRAA